MSERQSRSQKRKVGDQSQRVAKALMALSAGQLSSLRLEDELKEEVRFSANVDAHGARRRELRRLGGVLRAYDLDEVEKIVHTLGDATRADGARFRQAEAWREQLLAKDEVAEKFLLSVKNVDRAELEAAIAGGRLEQENGQPKGGQRKLFRLVREWLEASGQAETASEADQTASEESETTAGQE